MKTVETLDKNPYQKCSMSYESQHRKRKIHDTFSHPSIEYTDANECEKGAA